MTYDISKEWCLAMAELEVGATPGAGSLAMRPYIEEETMLAEAATEDSRIAFGRFINLMRRSHTLSIEKLAEDADIDIGELMSIEEDTHYTPKPRTVYQLASVFNVSRSRLMGLSGLVRPKDAHFLEEVVRYAARSESLATLSAVEQAALDGMIAVLSKRKG